MLSHCLAQPVRLTVMRLLSGYEYTENSEADVAWLLTKNKEEVLCPVSNFVFDYLFQAMILFI